jgi:hypothetical protein
MLVRFPDDIPEPRTYPVKNGWHASPPEGGRAAWGKTEDGAKIAYIAGETIWREVLGRVRLAEPVLIPKVLAALDEQEKE